MWCFILILYIYIIILGQLLWQCEKPNGLHRDQPLAEAIYI